MQRLHLLILATAALLMGILPSSSASEPVIIDETLKNVEIGRNLEYLEDSAGTISINTIISEKNTGRLRWLRSNEDKLGFGFTSSHYWIRFSLHNRAPKDMILYLKQEYPLIDYLTLYIPEKDGAFSSIKTGDNYPFAHRPLKYRNFIFPLKIKGGGTNHYYLHYKTGSSVNIQLSVISPSAFRKFKDSEIIFYWLYYGILLVLFVYNLILFLATRDRNYLYYILYIASFGIFTMSLNGMAYQYLWPENVWLGNFATPIAMSVITVTLITFALSFMEIRAYSKVWDIILKAIAGLAAVLLILTLTISNYRFSITAATALSGLAAPIGMGLIIHFVFFKKSRPAIFITISGVLFLAGALMSVLQLGGIVPATVVTMNGILVGSVLQVIILSFGLADRINILRNNLQFLNAGLEKIVEERTEELQAANEEIEAINADLIKTRDSLWGEMQLAKKIQTVLLPDKPTIKGYEITAYMQPADDVGGDYYDIINAGGIDWILIGDVSGHGVPAGLVMMMAQTAINTIIEDQPHLSPSDVLVKVNKTICRNIRKLDDDKYMTIIALATYKDGSFTFSGLHQDIMVFRKESGKVDLIDTDGMWIGIMDELNGMVSDNSFTIKKGDTILLYTDGITEAWEKGSVRDRRDPDVHMFGAKRLEDIFTEVAERPLEDIKNSIISALKNYDCHDDITMVLLRHLG